MINIVIVDDDILAITKLKQLIQLNNVKVVGEFTQSTEALKFISLNKVDILLTDMNMPKMDGIELIQKSKIYKPELQIIAISSYKDFNYVKDSFKEGSIDYILKYTLDEETLANVLTEACTNIRKNSKKNHTVSSELIEASKQTLRPKLLTQLLKEEITAEEVEEKLKVYDIEMDIASTMMVVCEIDDYSILTKDFTPKDKNIFLKSTRQLIETVLASVPDKEIIRIQDGRYVLFLIYTGVKSQLYIYTNTLQYSKYLNQYIKKMMNINLSIGIGKCCHKISDINVSYNKCEEMIKNKFFEGKGRVYNQYKQQSKENNLNKIEVKKEVSNYKIYEALQAGDQSYLTYLKRIFEHYRENKYTKQLVVLQLVEFINFGIKIIKGKKIEKLNHIHFNTIYNKLKQVETVDEMQHIIERFYEQITKEMTELKDLYNQEYSKYTVSTIKYIEKNYMNPISLEDIASELGVNNSYLSKIFKSDTEINFIKYLNTYRISRSIELIEANKYKIKEIYTMVGFSQYNYFFKVFKQYVGKTPLEYEKDITTIL